MEELNLFQFPAIHMTELCACSPEIVWSKMIESHPFCAPSNNIPDHVLGDPFAPWRSMTANSPENPTR